MTDVTVVVNAHREGLLAKHTLDSVQRAASAAVASGISVEVIVAADRPDDITLEVLRAAPGVNRIIEMDYGDLGSSRNAASQTAKGRWLAFIDADDIWGENWLIDAAKIADHTRRKVILHPECSVIFGDPRQHHIFAHTDMDTAGFDPWRLLVDNYWTSAAFVATEAVKNIPYLRSSIKDGIGHEDWNWNVRTIEQGYVHKVVPGTVHFIRRRPGSLSRLALANEAMCIPVEYFRQLLSGLPAPRAPNPAMQ